MKVELVALTQPYKAQEQVNPMIVSETAACVCYDSEPSDNFRVAKGCIVSGHMSVMEHINFTFHITGISRALLAQLSRHRHISLSVRSQRYCVEDEFQDIDPFQNDEDKECVFRDAMQSAQDFYNDLIKLDAKQEDARMVLPNACCTELYMTANARTLIEISYLRLCNRAQKEIRDLFKEIKKVINEACPEVAEHMVPKCEMYKKYPFCTEHNSCGKHPKLKDVYRN